MISIIIIFTASLFFLGIVNKTRSLVSGRKGPGIFQPVKDILRLFGKGSVYSSTSSYIFRIAPSIYFASVVIAIFMVPHGNVPGIISFNGDFIMFAYLLGLGKFLMIVAALDTGSSFEGMGASREALFSMLIEPAFFILMGSFALFTGYTSFYSIFNTLHFGNHISYLIGGLSTFVLLLIAMTESSRMPVDDPKTHLELTMIHEVMILDNSGIDLAMIMYATLLKMVMYGSLITNFFIGGLPLFMSIPMFFMIQGSLAICIGLIESFMARFRMNHNPQYILMLTSVSLLVFFVVLLILTKFN